MKFSLRKGHSHIHITCQDEFFSNNIIGDNFEIEYENSVNRIHISIESNLKQRNKHSNSYSDTKALIRKAGNIKSVQIDEVQVIKGLLSAHQKHPKNSWELVLHASDDKLFKYIIKPSSSLDSVFLDVIGV